MRIFAVGTKIFGGPGQHLGGLCPPGPNVEPPLIVNICVKSTSPGLEIDVDVVSFNEVSRVRRSVNRVSERICGCVARSAIVAK